MNYFKYILGSTFVGVLVAGLTIASSARATLIDYNLAWSGADFLNEATATGTITLDDAIVPVPGNLFGASAATVGITAFKISISGASAGNGTFGLSDFDGFVWAVGPGLDLSVELVGQSGFFDFNIFNAATSPTAPRGVGEFLIETNGGVADLLALTAFTPTSVPEPGALALVGFGLVGLGVLRRRRQQR